MISSSTQDQIAEKKRELQALERLAAREAHAADETQQIRVAVRLSRTLKFADESYEKIEFYLEDFCWPEKRLEVMQALKAEVQEQLNQHLATRGGQTVARQGPQVRIVHKETDAADIPFMD